MKIKYLHIIFVVAVISLIISSCHQSSSEDSAKEVTEAVSDDSKQVNESGQGALPEWAVNANIYEVNIRQFTKEGTFSAFEKHLPRLKEMGVDILWLMPVFPISSTKRKGGLGSYYAVSDFEAVNPEFGTMNDFKQLVKSVHDQDMYLILDWVPNHTGWDHVWLKENQNWFTQNDKGEVVDPIDPNTGKSWGWTDVADLNYENEAMRLAMIRAMKFWIEKIDIDGYRMDVAHGVPDNFWDQVSAALFPLKSIFMLAESETPYHRNSGAFHMTYGWSFHHLMNGIAKGDHTASEIDTLMHLDREKFKKGFHMYFTSNHDENSWAGTVFERMGDGHKTLAVLANTFDGMPLLYGGQEAPLKKRLEFFEKDAIEWGNYEYAEFYSTLLALKKENKALWNGRHGGSFHKIETGKDDQVYAFFREKDGDKIIAILNLSKEMQEIHPTGERFYGAYKDVFNHNTTTIEEGMNIFLKPWDYMLLSNR